MSSSHLNKHAHKHCVSIKTINSIIFANFTKAKWKSNNYRIINFI